MPDETLSCISRCPSLLASYRPTIESNPHCVLLVSHKTTVSSTLISLRPIFSTIYHDFIEWVMSFNYLFVRKTLLAVNGQFKDIYWPAPSQYIRLILHAIFAKRSGHGRNHWGSGVWTSPKFGRTPNYLHSFLKNRALLCTDCTKLGRPV